MKRPTGVLTVLLLLVAVVSHGENESENKDVKPSSSEWIEVDEKPTFFEIIEINGVKQIRYATSEEMKKKHQEYIRTRDSQKLNNSIKNNALPK